MTYRNDTLCAFDPSYSICVDHGFRTESITGLPATVGALTGERAAFSALFEGAITNPIEASGLCPISLKDSSRVWTAENLAGLFS